jgi:hypothetical protein
MISLLELLRARGLDEHTRAKLVRHEERRYSMAELIRDGLFEEYQAHQGRPIFRSCSAIVSFIGQPQNRALFFGVYDVLGVEDCRASHRRRLPRYREWAKPGNVYYRLNKRSGFEDLERRLMIEWSSARAWHQWLVDREVLEVLPRGWVSDFPGYERILLSYEELQRIVADQAANRVWQQMLSAVSAVYLILDRSTGKQYVGSAYGESGLFQRWADYAKSGHGGNRLLQETVGNDRSYCHNFSFSVLQTFPRVTPKDEVLAAEAFHKAKLGTRAHGLNDN